jgi:hypothetical protein
LFQNKEVNVAAVDNKEKCGGEKIIEKNKDGI